MGNKYQCKDIHPERKIKQEQRWKKVENFFESYERKYSPASWDCCLWREGWYLLLRFIIVCGIFYVITTELNIRNIIFIVITGLLLFDLLVANASVAFVTMKPLNRLRSFLLTLFAFTHLIIAFAIFYKFFGDQFNSTTMCNTQLIYFSAVTITTLGYGDYLPTGAVTQWLVVFQLLTGIFFLTGVLSRIISKNKTEKKG